MTIEQELARADAFCMWICIIVGGGVIISVVALAIRAIWDELSVRMYLRRCHKMCQEAIEDNKAIDRGEKPGPYKWLCIGGRRY